MESESKQLLWHLVVTIKSSRRVEEGVDEVVSRAATIKDM
jgi:hypothetical protein